MGFRERKSELLEVLNCPQLPLHNNEAESDIREYVTRRKISGGTRSEAGRRARDTFVGLKKTCRKLGISFWHFLISRLRGDGQIPPLPDVIRARLICISLAFRIAMSFRFFDWLNQNREVFAAYKASLGFVWA
jgi:hypothetical protein